MLLSLVVYVLEYLSWRQNDCHTNNLHNTCLHKLTASLKTEEVEATVAEVIKDTQKQEKNELLFRLRPNTNYKTLPAMFRQGSFVLKDIVKPQFSGVPQ